METRIQSIHFDADKKLIEFAEKKAQKLAQFHDRIIDVDIYLKFDSASSAIKDKTADLKVNIPGTTLFASETKKTFEEAIDSSIESLIRQIKKHKEKIRN